MNYPTLNGNQVRNGSDGRVAMQTTERAFWQSRMTAGGRVAPAPVLVDLRKLARNVRATWGAVMCYVRCTRCGARRTLAKPLDEYLRPPQCRGYGCRSRRYYVDRYRATFERGPAAKACTCLGYSFPHRRGSLYCNHNPNITEDMMRERWEEGAWA